MFGAGNQKIDDVVPKQMILSLQIGDIYKLIDKFRSWTPCSFQCSRVCLALNFFYFFSDNIDDMIWTCTISSLLLTLFHIV